MACVVIFWVLHNPLIPGRVCLLENRFNRALLCTALCRPASSVSRHGECSAGHLPIPLCWCPSTHYRTAQDCYCTTGCQAVLSLSSIVPYYTWRRRLVQAVCHIVSDMSSSNGGGFVKDFSSVQFLPCSEAITGEPRHIVLTSQNCPP